MSMTRLKDWTIQEGYVETFGEAWLKDMEAEGTGKR